MSLKEKFDLAVEVANKLPSASNEDMLELYGWFKQANIGDVNTGARGPDHQSSPQIAPLVPDLTKPFPNPHSSTRHARLQG